MNSNTTALTHKKKSQENRETNFIQKHHTTSFKYENTNTTRKTLLSCTKKSIRELYEVYTKNTAHKIPGWVKSLYDADNQGMYQNRLWSASYNNEFDADFFGRTNPTQALWLWGHTNIIQIEPLAVFQIQQVTRVFLAQCKLHNIWCWQRWERKIYSEGYWTRQSIVSGYIGAPWHARTTITYSTLVG